MPQYGAFGVPGTGSFVAVINNGDDEQYVTSREEAIAFAREKGAKSVDLWKRKKRPKTIVIPTTNKLMKLVDDSYPIEFDILVPPN